MILLTLIQITKLITEAEVIHLLIKVVFVIVGTIFSAIGAFILWGIKAVIKQFKDYKTTKEAELKVFHSKFEAINEYMNETDKVQYLHTNVLGDMKDKTKLLETKVEKHGRLLAEHCIEIKNLKE